jgi:hypothetical protein
MHNPVFSGLARGKSLKFQAGFHSATGIETVTPARCDAGTIL